MLVFTMRLVELFTNFKGETKTSATPAYIEYANVMLGVNMCAQVTFSFCFCSARFHQNRSLFGF